MTETEKKTDETAISTSDLQQCDYDFGWHFEYFVAKILYYKGLILD